MVKYQTLKKRSGEKYSIGIVGATGYTGSELVRILAAHPDVSIEVVTSEQHAGKQFSEIHPQYKNLVDIELCHKEDIKKKNLDLIFLALPHRVSMEFVRDYDCKNCKIIDLSGDFRLKSADIYEQWYETEHVAKADLKRAVFGLPELYRSKIRAARLVANPGCYPTSAILALAPLLNGKLIKPKGIIVDSKSGMTGAGAKAKAATHFPDVTDNFSAYGLLKHRHTPEIQETLRGYSGMKTEVLFTPHLLPIDRGILTTAYAIPNGQVTTEILRERFSAFYDTEHFVRVVEEPPSVKHVRGSNYCDVYVAHDERTNRVITVSVIDNLVKGAAGQAIQNMNIMFNLIENKGLKQLPLCP